MALLEEHPKRVLFIIFFICEFLGISAMISITYMLVMYFGGVSFTDPDPDGEDSLQRANSLWNIHGVLMSFGFLFLLGNGIVVYRLFRDFKLKKVKWVHLALMTVAFVLIILGIITGYNGNEIYTGKHFTSLHAWFGLLCTFIFVVQFLSAIPILIFKVTNADRRDYFAALHAFFGILNFILAMVIVCIGIARKNLVAVVDFGYYSWQAMLLNYAGVAVTCFTAAVFYISVNPFFEYDKVDDI